MPDSIPAGCIYDVDVLECFKSQGAGYQAKINAILKAFKEASG